MKPHHRLLAAPAVLLASLALAFAAAPRPHPRSFTGQIMDSQCAAMGNHNAGYKMTGTHTPRECTLACVRAGGHFVLYNTRSKITYKLDNQKAPRAFAGEQVTVIGTLRPGAHTIHVEEIEPIR
ncbi:MAG: DUF5818 domain-containing protein [Terriglobales bacterium]